MRWPLGDGGDAVARLTSAFAWFLDRLAPTGMVWEVGGGDGAAVWIPPEGGDAWQEAQDAMSRVRELTDDAGRRFDLFWGWVASNISDERGWHLDSIAVEAELRGRGIGAALIEFGLSKASADRTGAFLETGNPANVAYYERFGFRTIAQADAPGGGPHIWFMRRDP